MLFLLTNDILKLSSILKLEICKFIKRDSYMNKTFNMIPRSLAHSYNTRFNTDIFFVTCTKLTAYFVFHNGVKV